MHEIVGLDSLYLYKSISAGALGFSETAIPTFRYTIAGRFKGIIRQGLHRLLLKILQATASTQ